MLYLEICQHSSKDEIKGQRTGKPIHYSTHNNSPKVYFSETRSSFWKWDREFQSGDYIGPVSQRVKSVTRVSRKKCLHLPLKRPLPPIPLPPPSRSIAENTKNHRVNTHRTVCWTSRGRDTKAHSLRLPPLVCHLFILKKYKGSQIIIDEKCLLFYEMFILW